MNVPVQHNSNVLAKYGDKLLLREITKDCCRSDAPFFGDAPCVPQIGAVFQGQSIKDVPINVVGGAKTRPQLWLHRFPGDHRSVAGVFTAVRFRVYLLAFAVVAAVAPIVIIVLVAAMVTVLFMFAVCLAQERLIIQSCGVDAAFGAIIFIFVKRIVCL